MGRNHSEREQTENENFRRSCSKMDATVACDYAAAPKIKERLPKMEAALGCADILYQGVGSVSNRCPYFRKEESRKIVCVGIAADSDMHQTFASSKEKFGYVRDYCNGFYASCPVAQILNECHGRYKTTMCPHNASVDCLNATECHDCGWNPAIAAERLRKWMKIHSCDA